MGDPSNVAQVTVTGTWRMRLSDGTTVPATGYVTFTPTTRLQDGGSSEILPVAPVSASFDAGGHISVTLMATDDTDLAPSGWGYQVDEHVAGAVNSYFALFPAAVPTVDLSTISPAVVVPLIAYVSLSAVGAPSGVASLDSGGQVPLGQLGNVPGGQSPSGTVVSETAFGQSSAAGASSTYSRGDHTHGTPAAPSIPSPSGTVTSSAEGDAGAAGASSAYSRGDHVHGRESFGGAPGTTMGIGSSSSAGVATTPSRSDHSHATQAAGTPGSSAEGDAAAAGSAATFARSDHVHGRESFGGAPGTTEAIGTAGAAGAATTPSRSDHVHPMAAAGAPGASAVGDTQSTGVATTFAASDHRHAREAFGGTPAQVTVGAGTAGAATTETRSDHAHASATWAPSDLGYAGWSIDPAVCGASTPTSVVAGTVQVIEIIAPVGQTVTAITMQVQTAGATLTSGQCFAALYDANKNLLQTTADQSAAWVSGGTKNMTISSQAVTAGKLYVAWFYNGTTPPRFLANVSGTGVVNGQLSAVNARFATADTGRTTSMPATLGAFTASGQAVFAAIF